MERGHDGDEDGEGREYNKLHDWGVREVVVSKRGSWGGRGAVEGVLYGTGEGRAFSSF